MKEAAVMSEVDLRTDVIVVGAGNAGLCAAVAALEAGAEAIVLEKAPKPLRGGNTAYTGFYRFAYDGLDDLKSLVEISDADAPMVSRPFGVFTTAPSNAPSSLCKRSTKAAS